jgi:hypothetical protein
MIIIQLILKQNSHLILGYKTPNFGGVFFLAADDADFADFTLISFCHPVKGTLKNQCKSAKSASSAVKIPITLEST